MRVPVAAALLVVLLQPAWADPGENKVTVDVPAFAASRDLIDKAVAATAARARIERRWLDLQDLLAKGPVRLGGPARGCLIDKTTVRFHFRGAGAGAAVYVCGALNGWARADAAWRLAWDPARGEQCKTVPLTRELASALTFFFVAGGDYVFAE